MEQDYLANELQIGLEKLTNQARFIQMIVDKQLVVSNRKKVDIVVDLRKHGFRPFPKVAAAKAAGEPQDAQEDDEDNDEDEMNVASGKGKGGSKAETTGDFDYLLGMAIWSLTKEKIEKLKSMADDKEKELLKLLEKTPKSMWSADLDEFMSSWEVRAVPFVVVMGLMNELGKVNCQKWEGRTIGGQKARKGKRKPAVLQTRKSIGAGKGSDDDDDFKPIKAPAAKRKAARETARPPKSTVKKITKEEDKDVNMSKLAAAKKKAPEQKKVKDESEEDYSEEEVVKPKAKAAAAPAKRKVSAEKKKGPSKQESDDDYDMEVVQRAAPPKRKAATKATVIDSDSNVVMLPSKAKGKEHKV